MSYRVQFLNAAPTLRMAAAFRQVFERSAETLCAGTPPVLDADPIPNQKPDNVVPIRTTPPTSKESSCSNDI